MNMPPIVFFDTVSLQVFQFVVKEVYARGIHLEAGRESVS